MQRKLDSNKWLIKVLDICDEVGVSTLVIEHFIKYYVKERSDQN